MSAKAAIRAEKLRRIRAGAKPRMLELCSGCGGMSLGFATAGFNLAAHIESDETAAASYALNFSPPPGVALDSWARARDMVNETAGSVVSELKLSNSAESAFDVLAAGLPCQAFARIGRSKLRAVAGEDDAYRNDPRATLYKRFLDYVEEVQPLAIVIENVPDILNFGGHNIPEEISETLEAAGYVARYTLLNSAFYGVPQIRERLFLVAVDRSLGAAPSVPSPVRRAELPSGYEAARTVALRHVPKDGSHFLEFPEPADGLPSAVSVRDALSDLPWISEHFRDPKAMRRRKVSDQLPYRSNSELSGFAKTMREWPGFRAGQTVSGAVVRLTPRDFEIFRRMPSGTDYPGALRIAEEIFSERVNEMRDRPRRGSKAWNDLRAGCVPPYDPGKFPNKWWKLQPQLPSRTLTAHMGKDTYSHIHWNSLQQRTISVREAARLQSFPDGFQFAGAMNAAFRQIGNAVPPLLAQAVAAQLHKELLGLPIQEAATASKSNKLAA
jgi:DNA (cytosine-5)-methyltransferase 1